MKCGIRKITKPLLSLAVITCLASTTALAQHGHLNAGAVGQNQNDKLLWANGAIFATNSGFVQNMPMTGSGRFAGYFNSAPTLTALPATVTNSGPVAFSPALGSFLQFQMTVISGPDGGSFGWWESSSLTPLYSLGIGQTSPLIALSDVLGGAGTPTGDPFGHLHGRRFTATTEGDYIIGLQIFDTSANGVGGAPIHMPSDMFYMEFAAVPEPGTVTLLGLALGGVMWQVRRRRKQC
jgi:hypothetical protein